jgi:hypothetical protein
MTTPARLPLVSVVAMRLMLILIAMVSWTVTIRVPSMLARLPALASVVVVPLMPLLVSVLALVLKM